MAVSQNLARPPVSRRQRQAQRHRRGPIDGSRGNGDPVFAAPNCLGYLKVNSWAVRLDANHSVAIDFNSGLAEICCQPQLSRSRHLLHVKVEFQTAIVTCGARPTGVAAGVAAPNPMRQTLVWRRSRLAK